MNIVAIKYKNSIYFALYKYPIPIIAININVDLIVLLNIVKSQFYYFKCRFTSGNDTI